MKKMANIVFHMKIVYTPGSLVQDLGVIQLHISSSVKGPDSDKVRHSGPDSPDSPDSSSLVKLYYSNYIILY